VVRAIWAFCAPLGVAFSPGRSGRTVLRAGGGIYYDSSLSIATDAIIAVPDISAFTSGRNGFVNTGVELWFVPICITAGDAMECFGGHR